MHHCLCYHTTSGKVFLNMVLPVTPYKKKPASHLIPCYHDWCYITGEKIEACGSVARRWNIVLCFNTLLLYLSLSWEADEVDERWSRDMVLEFSHTNAVNLTRLWCSLTQERKHQIERKGYNYFVQDHWDQSFSHGILSRCQSKLMMGNSQKTLKWTWNSLWWNP